MLLYNGFLLDYMQSNLSDARVEILYWLFVMAGNAGYFPVDFVIMSRSNENRFVVVHSMDINKDDSKQYVVYFDVGSIIHCSCGLFEHMGMVCRHSLKVLVSLDQCEIPPGNIMHRWTKAASKEFTRNDFRNKADSMFEDTDKMRKKLLLERVLQLTNSKSSLPDDVYLGAMRALGHGDKGKTTTNCKDSGDLYSTVWDSNNPLPSMFPARICAGGRPPNTSMNSFLAASTKYGAKKIQEEGNRRSIR